MVADINKFLNVLKVEVGALRLPGYLRLPESPEGLVLFAHGSGSSRNSPRNNAVAQALQRDGFASLLFDLLSSREELDRRNVFDIPLLADRLLLATEWVREQERLASLPVGYFGASTGSAAALIAAARAGEGISAVVSRGGRPDLAGNVLASVTAPTLLIVGGNDQQVLTLNRAALTELRCEKELAIVPGATHLFEEPGTLESVMELASDWFRQHFAALSGSGR
jgi:putative phosphoribosyl transferase